MSALLLLAATWTATVTAQAPGYARLRADSDDPDPHCLWWRSPALTLHFQQDGLADVAGDAEFAAVRRSMAAWQTAMESCSALTLTEGAPVESKDVAYTTVTPTRNVLVFRTAAACRDVVPDNASCRKVSMFHCANVYDCWPHASAALAVTSSFHDPTTGEILDADIEFNAARFRFTATADEGPTCVPPNYEGCVYYDLENTMTHELGHFVGLDHVGSLGSTMNPQAAPGETDKRSIDPDSQQFLCDAYPPGQYPRDCVLDRLDPELGPAACATAGSAPLWMALLVWAGALGRRRTR